VKQDAPIAVGTRGSYRGVAFVVRGRLELRHESGSAWEEWYAAFADGRDGWIARADGRWLVTFGGGSWLPSWRDVEVGRNAWPAFVVVEKGSATFAAKDGKLPFRPRLGKSYRYADLRGSNGAFATIDYGDDPPSLFVGRRASTAELGLRDAQDVRGPHRTRPRKSSGGR
jgi:hypothetical protein